MVQKRKQTDTLSNVCARVRVHIRVAAQTSVCQCSSVLAWACDRRQLVTVAPTRYVTLHLSLSLKSKLSRRYTTLLLLFVWSWLSRCIEHFPCASIFSWEVGDRDSLAPFPQAAVDKTDKP